MPGEMGKTVGKALPRVCLLGLCCGLSLDTHGVAELLPYNDNSTSMTWTYSENLAYKQSLMGSWEVLMALPDTGPLNLACWAWEPGFLPALATTQLKAYIYVMQWGKCSAALKPSRMAADSHQTEEEPSHMATSQTHYQSLPTHLTSKPIFTSAPTVISEWKSDATLWHDIKYSAEVARLSVAYVYWGGSLS